MEFWGVEVKPGETVKCDPEADNLHISQASLGVIKKGKGNESVLITAKIDGKDMVIGTLSAGNCPQIQYDLVFEKEFELSHNWKDGSVFFVGYRIAADVEMDDFSGDEIDSEFEEDVQLAQKANGNAKKTVPLKAKESVKAEEDNDDDEDDDSDYGDDSEDGDESDEEMVDVEDESEDEDDSSDEEGDATPKKAENGKKRSAESVSKTPVSQKKAKLDTSASKVGASVVKKGTHTATPHPAKQAGKTNEKSKPQTPKSAGSVSCK